LAFLSKPAALEHELASGVLLFCGRLRMGGGDVSEKRACETDGSGSGQRKGHRFVSSVAAEGPHHVLVRIHVQYAIAFARVGTVAAPPECLGDENVELHEDARWEGRRAGASDGAVETLAAIDA